MKARVELVVSGVKTVVKKMLEPAQLSPAVYATQAKMICRMDGRDITEIALEGGYTGREFSGTVKDARHYLLINRPSIGYGGCEELSHALKFSEGREPLNMHVHITCPAKNKVVVMPSVVLRYHIGDYESEPGSKCLTIHQLLAEQEILTVNDVLMPQFLASVERSHLTLLKDGVRVPNQLKISGVDEAAPEIVTRQDCANSTSMMLTCMRQSCNDKATVIATKLEAERMLIEAKKNDYSKTTQQELIQFWNAANPLKDKFKIPEDAGFSVAMSSRA